MLRYTAYTFILIILNVVSILIAQDSNNHPLLPTLNECGQLNLAQFVNRTDMAQTDEFPWMAKIVYHDPRIDVTSYRCSAVLINQRYLVTVASCLESMGVFEAYAVLFNGSPRYSRYAPKQTQPLAIEEIIVHPRFNKRESSNDIALLRLNESISYTNNISPICLPGPNIKHKDFVAKQLHLAGWYKAGDWYWNLHKLSLVARNALDCQGEPSGLARQAGSQMCGVACFNQEFAFDIGSALMDTFGQTNYYLVGLLTAVNKNCSTSEPDIFTRVDYFLDWIANNMDA